MDQGNEPPNQTFFGTFAQDSAIQCVVYMDGLYHHQAKREHIPPQDDMGGDEDPPALPHNKHDRPQNPMGGDNMPQAPQQQQQQNNDNTAEAGVAKDNHHQQQQQQQQCNEAADNSDGHEDVPVAKMGEHGLP